LARLHGHRSNTLVNFTDTHQEKLKRRRIVAFRVVRDAIGSTRVFAHLTVRKRSFVRETFRCRRGE
jgi:hypothetical protein